MRDRCSICGGRMEEWPGGGGFGNNAWPIKDGRCCNACDVLYVIPARIKRLLAAEKAEAQEGM